MKQIKKTAQTENTDYVSQIIDRIDKVLGNTTGDPTLAILILKTINQLREKNSPFEEIRGIIAAKAGLSTDDPKLNQIFFEVDEKPIQESYQPFNNDLFKSLRSRLEQDKTTN